MDNPWEGYPDIGMPGGDFGPGYLMQSKTHRDVGETWRFSVVPTQRVYRWVSQSHESLTRNDSGIGDKVVMRSMVNGFLQAQFFTTPATQWATWTNSGTWGLSAYLAGSFGQGGIGALHPVQTLISTDYAGGAPGTLAPCQNPADPSVVYFPVSTSFSSLAQSLSMVLVLHWLLKDPPGQAYPMRVEIKGNIVCGEPK